MEVVALHGGRSDADPYRSLVRCDIPDTQPESAADDSTPGISAEENQSAPTADEVFAELDRAFALDRALVVMWGSMAYRFHLYTQRKQLPNPFARARVLDLQAAVVMHYDIKTSQCKGPQGVIRLLNLIPRANCWSRGPLPFVHAMNAVMEKLIIDGWTPESTPDAVIDGSDLGQDAEEMRIDRWEQIRERQNNLGVERRPAPAAPTAFVVLDGEHVSLRHERFARLIELALVVAYRKELPGGRVAYELGETSFTSLVRVRMVEETTHHAWTMTGIDPEAVRRAPPLPRVIADMEKAAPLDKAVLVTWGPDDARIITQNCVNAGIPSPITKVPLVDLQRAFSRFYELGTQQVSLQNAAAQLGIDTSSREMHRALDDTLVTWYVLDRMLADGWTPQWRPWHRREESAM